ncbi:MAG TPA: hypothetical protein VFQ80_09165 [Thermomicrobiales bacterium]|jgi:hypothetical protein|nr:hypothetical protein [Thermomicrobiales bacterium]
MRDETPGAAGHPQPGSQHDDGKTETTAAGPPEEPTDGVPGAHGAVETAGGPLTETEEEGAAIVAESGEEL